MQTIRLLTSWDDSCHQNFRLADLLTRNRIPAIFFLEANQLGLDQAAKLSKEHKIGSHTVTHPRDIKRCEKEQLEDEIAGSKYLLEQAIGLPVTTFAYPRGRHNYPVRKTVADAGYRYARTTLVLRTEYSDPFQATTTAHCAPRAEYQGQRWDHVVWEYIQRRANVLVGAVHLWGHAWEIEKHNDWDRLERLLKRISTSYAIEDIRPELEA